MILKNATILDESFVFQNSDIEILGNNIANLGKICGDNEIDLRGKYIVPGLVDIHTHGCAGYDSSADITKDNIDKMSDFYALHGVTTYLATVTTCSKERTLDAVKRINNAVQKGVSGANIGGIHLEGPFFSMEKKGAQNPDFIRHPDYHEFMTLYNESGKIVRIISIAPETKGAVEFIKKASSLVRVSIGHTDADEEQARKAISAGALNMTHTFNGMRSLHHRTPNAVGAALDSDNVICEFICDGYHINKTIIRLMYKLIGPDRMALISDSLLVAGLTDGVYQRADAENEMIVENGLAKLSDGTICGSASNLFVGVKNAISFGISPEHAFKMGSLTPAKAAGIDDVCGSISVGKRADLLILDKDFNLENVIVRGVFIKR